MRHLFYVFTILIFISCNSRETSKTQNTHIQIKKEKKESNKIPLNNSISIVGKWYRFSTQNGFTEFDIDSNFVFMFNQKTGWAKREYKLENDYFRYLDSYKYGAKVTNYGDSVFFQGNDNTTATLYKYDESVAPFESIPEENDPAMESFIKDFDERALIAWEKAGIKFMDR